MYNDYDIMIYDVYDSMVFHRYQLNLISYQFSLLCHDGKISSDSVFKYYFENEQINES